jgi:hypothetical protein
VSVTGVCAAMDSENQPGSEWHRSRLKLWDSSCRRHRIPEGSVPLFECDSRNIVLTKEIGIGRRQKVLRRSSLMEAIMRAEAQKAVDDHVAAGGLYDGLIYVMHTRGSEGVVVPRYACLGFIGSTFFLAHGGGGVAISAPPFKP